MDWIGGHKAHPFSWNASARNLCWSIVPTPTHPKILSHDIIILKLIVTCCDQISTFETTGQFHGFWTLFEPQLDVHWLFTCSSSTSDLLWNTLNSCHPLSVSALQVLLLVGGFNHLEKYEFVNGKDDIPYIMENNNCLKPPTSYYLYTVENRWANPHHPTGRIAIAPFLPRLRSWGFSGRGRGTPNLAEVSSDLHTVQQFLHQVPLLPPKKEGIFSQSSSCSH